MRSPSLGETFCGRSLKGVEDLGFTHQTLTLTQGEATGEISLQGYRDSFCLFDKSCAKVDFHGIVLGFYSCHLALGFWHV